MSKPATQRRPLSTVGGVGLVATTYVYFLLFAQFGFLDLLQARLGQRDWVELAMLAMGLSGLGVSLATGACLRDDNYDRALRFALIGCAGTAALAPLLHSPAPLLVVAAATGAFTGLLTVTVATGLRRMLSPQHLATWVGVGTGTAYLICNLPPLFAGSIALRCWFPAFLCLAASLWFRSGSGSGSGDGDGIGIGIGIGIEEDGPHGGDPTAAFAANDYAGLGFVSVVLSFLALIWLDSAAFAIIQETSTLRGATWGSSSQTVKLGLFHLAGAVTAGLLLDHGWFRSVLVAAFALLVVAIGSLTDWQQATSTAGPVYAFAVSLYSTALVAAPSLAPQAVGLVPIRWRAALLYGIAGWLGSALGVGMAQELHRIPDAFVWTAGLVLATGWALSRRTDLRRHLPIYGLPLTGIVAALALYGVDGGNRVIAEEDPMASASAGRAVYIAEGCINCHSQYVRPHGNDEALWGPVGGFSREHRPPLPGNRRQGPDLARVGNRRSAAWHRVHLMQPRILNPASRMPDYAHLFEDRRGDDLVAYLASLGAETIAVRYEQSNRAPIATAPRPASAERGELLFEQYCIACHGEEARGDGPLAPKLRTSAAQPMPGMNLRKPRFVLVPWGQGAEPEAMAVARVVRYGITNTSMPGHETLDDQEIADLAAYVLALHHDEGDSR